MANQVGPAHIHQRLTQQRPVVGIVVAQKRLVQLAPVTILDHIHFFRAARQLFQRIASGVPHGGGQRHRRGGKRLHLVGLEAIGLQP